MTGKQPILIFGASARATAFSALRAGMEPWCADLFADADLRARCLATRLQPGQYPHGFLGLVLGDAPGPWMYTGALENRPELIDRMARVRPLWGNAPGLLAGVRDHPALARRLGDAGVPCPAVHEKPDEVPERGKWLIKPRSGAGGAGVRFWDRKPPGRLASVYFQEYVEGTACSAVFVSNAKRVWLLGATRQLIGEPWLHAQGFHYCGSLGPLRLPRATLRGLRRLGEVLLRPWRPCLCGLFGVDFVLRNGVPWPVEVNPRYTASVEVLEYAQGLRALDLHRRSFESGAALTVSDSEPNDWVGKALYFAPAPLKFPDDGPWAVVLRSPGPVEEMPGFADVPNTGERIEAGRPVLTFFARAGSEEECLAALRRTAADLDRLFFGTTRDPDP